MIKVYPVKFEAYDDMQEPVFKLECMDEFAATLTVDTVISKESWPEISAAVQLALNQMFADEPTT